jgi:choline monooxygenase
MIFRIDPDIRRAETLSSRFYTDEKFFRESKEKIFARTWHLAATIDEIENVKPLFLLENFLDKPILLTKDGGKLHCLANVCTHRGKILIEKDCRANLLRCGYHGRRFALNGKFLSMPEFEQTENFPSEKDDLPQIPFEIWEKFLFVSLNPIAPLKDFLAETRRASWKNLRFSGAKDYFVQAHWALYCENYLEGFHIPFVHHGLNQAIDYDTYTTETFRYSSLQTAFDAKGNIAAQYFFIFPNLMLNFYPWGLSVNVVKPLDKNTTKVSYLTFVADESKLGTGAGADLETVELEDQAVVESVQKGIKSGFYEKGRYSPTREQGIHHFHRLIAEFMEPD